MPLYGGNMSEIGAAIGYGMQKFHEALSALIWLGSIQERLHRASIFLSMLTPDSHLPAELRSEFRELRNKAEQANSLNDEEAAIIASRVLEMAHKVNEEYWKWEESVY
jgi:hypothetical protein